MDGYFIKSVGTNRGKPRVWFQGLELERAGFEPGQSYEIEVKGRTLVLTLNPDGSRVVSPKKVRSRTLPVIDLNSRELLAAFDGMASVRVVIKDGAIYVLPLASELKKVERFQRLRQRLEQRQPLRIGSSSHGGGIMSHAIHEGLRRAGIASEVKFANEIRPELLEHASAYNDAWTQDTIPLAAPMQELAFDERGLAQVPQVEIYEIGIPCSGASRAGRAKRGLGQPEDHPEVGHLVVPTLILLNKAAPAICVFECVPLYATSASASILRTQLRELGYTTHERIMSGKEWGALEDRERWCMVAVTQGIEFDFDQLMPPEPRERKLKEILEDVPLDDPRWQKFEYLVDKQERDAAKGSNFKMQIADESVDKVGTITKGYAKIRSTDWKLRHPERAELMRLFTPVEHARLKGAPEHLLGDASVALQHEILGQSVVYDKFVDVGHHVGNSVNRLMGRAEVPMVNRATLFRNSLGIDGETADLAANVVAELSCAEPREGRYVGQIVASGQGVLVQQTHEGVGVLHDALAFRERPALGSTVEIQYRDGLALVERPQLAHAASKALAKFRAMEDSIPADYAAGIDDQVPTVISRPRFR